MSPLIPATSDGEYTADQIQRELQRWHNNLQKAKTDGDILGVHTALAFIDTWLDRHNALKAPA